MPILQLRIESSHEKIPIFIGNRQWKVLADFLIKNYPSHAIFVISDSTVAELYGGQIEELLHVLPRSGGLLTFPAGEASKTRRQLNQLADRILRRKPGRDSLIVALGGGVTGDLAGFLAAILYRGLPFIQVPTSLLAQVDSSVGGKVGINTPAGKNLIGAFHHPAAVFIQSGVLRTLPAEEIRNGLAEVIKMGAIVDPLLLQLLTDDPAAVLNARAEDRLEKIISRCIRQKMEVVARDEKESGYRSLLNFGHTVGHALERLSGYRVRHGFAVAAGMHIATQLSRRLLGFPAEQATELERVLQIFGLDTVRPGEYDLAQVWQLIRGDKKARGGKVRFTLLERFGRPRLFHPVTREELADAFYDA